MILHEIQPRDTNYYFTRAKILKESCGTDLEKLVDDKPVDVSEDMRGNSNAPF